MLTPASSAKLEMVYSSYIRPYTKFRLQPFLRSGTAQTPATTMRKEKVLFDS